MTFPLSETRTAYRPAPAPGRGWSPNECVAVALGLTYLMVGVVTAAIWTGAQMAVSDDPQAMGFSPLRILSYLGLGAVLLAAAAHGSAKRANSILGAAYLLVGLVGITLGGEGARLLTLNHVDSVIQLCTAAVLLGFGRTQD